VCSWGASGNIGATNAVRTLGMRLGLVVFVADVLKSALPVLLAKMTLGEAWAVGPWVPLIALAAVLGHVFPPWLGFRGGKGVASALGVFLAVAPALAGLALVVYGITLAIARVSAIASLTATTALLVLVPLWTRDPWLTGLALVVGALVWWRHRENVAQLRSARGSASAPSTASTAPDDEVLH
jgi:glycerol-3-phosphate acyltransferase PlsY